jgi:hypothetical protein
VSYLNCSLCGLSLKPRFEELAPANCPRCIARRRQVQPLFRSPLPFRELAATEPDAGAGGSATGSAPRQRA